MPGLLQYQLDQESSANLEESPAPVPSDESDASKTKRAKEEIEDAKIWLPSKVDASARRRVCHEGLP